MTEDYSDPGHESYGKRLGNCNKQPEHSGCILTVPYAASVSSGETVSFDRAAHCFAPGTAEVRISIFLNCPYLEIVGFLLKPADNFLKRFPAFDRDPFAGFEAFIRSVTNLIAGGSGYCLPRQPCDSSADGPCMQVIRGCQEIENASFRQRRCFVTADRFQEIGVVLPAFDFGVCILSARGGADPDRLLSVR